MARPKTKHPTPAELEVLKILWQRDLSSVRDVMDALNQRRRSPRAYTSVMSLLNVMVEKGLVVRERSGRAFLYRANLAQEKTLGRMVGDLCRRAFEGSASTLVSHLLDHASPTEEELAAIREAIEEYGRERGEDH
ncbi:MAG: BlaI/MecI/CopY family transcriptional regulator [Planctomycetes bacterium]|nr:BlaI/MecI/CopY family transcriptional regulator [Planctomycetota bacterium]